ncbi:surfactant protein B [Cooperia oncophora]
MFVKACVLVALVAVAFAQRATPPAPTECQICEHLIAQARHHFNNNVRNEKALQQELLNECKHLPPQEASGEQTCIDMVNKNIDKIFSDIQAGDRDGQTCFDIGACTSIPTFQTRPYHTRPPVALRAQRQ